MNEEITDRIEVYLLHNPVENTEGVISEFDTEKLQKAEEEGAVFLALYSSGRRAIVKAAEIVEPEPMMNGVVLVKPEYVDDRMVAVVDVFDALASQLFAPAAYAMAADDSAESNAEPTMARTGNPFETALERLKVIVNGNSRS